MAFICCRGDRDCGYGIIHGISITGSSRSKGWCESTRTDGQITQSGISGYPGYDDRISFGNGGVLSGDYDSDGIGADIQIH
jgi:hypothetical protein